LSDYEKTREIVAFDNNGDLLITIEWLDNGGYDNTMPANLLINMPI